MHVWWINKYINHNWPLLPPYCALWKCSPIISSQSILYPLKIENGELITKELGMPLDIISLMNPAQPRSNISDLVLIDFINKSSISFCSNFYRTLVFCISSQRFISINSSWAQLIESIHFATDDSGKFCNVIWINYCGLGSIPSSAA